MENQEIKTRPPVVVIMGHIDHGKSSLLEAIKDFKITSKESGGITQHIGAYEVEHQGKLITFIDTPGHAAFCSLRSRGAKIADMAILVIAADEGMKPQTIEALQCIQSAELPMIVAINKIDKPGANPVKLKNELMKNNILLEEYGGKIPAVETSAKTKQGISDLLEIILLTAEVTELKADYTKLASGAVIEAFLDSQRGPIATLLVQEGILKTQDIIATSSACGKIRAMEDFLGKSINEAHPSKPIIVMGFDKVPIVGEQFNVFLDQEEARKTLKEINCFKINQYTPKFGDKNLNLIIKADVSGTLEAIDVILAPLLKESEIRPTIIKSGVGEINEDDIQMAFAGKAKIFGFKSGINPQAKKLADQKAVDVYSFDVIYDLLQKTKELIKELIESETVRRDLGKLKVLVVFKTDPTRQIIGGRIIDGEFLPKAKVDILREEKKTGSGKILNLQKDKKEIEKAKFGEEIGILYEGSSKIKEGDVLIAFVEEKRKMDI
jgi:translation initiation factor IF-2